MPDIVTRQSGAPPPRHPPTEIRIRVRAALQFHDASVATILVVHEIGAILVSCCGSWHYAPSAGGEMQSHSLPDIAIQPANQSIGRNVVDYSGPDFLYYWKHNGILVFRLVRNLNKEIR